MEFARIERITCRKLQHPTDAVRLKHLDDGGRLEVVARYYGRVAADMIDAAVDRAIREEVGRLLVGKPEFKKAIHKMALEKLGEALLRP